MAKVQVGHEYVLGSLIGAGLAPCVCNSTFSPEHPCRVKISSVGRKYAKAMITGYTKPVQVGSGLEVNSNDGGLWDVDTAKTLYRQGLESRDAQWRAAGATCMLGAKRINELVNGL